jgi:DNA-binding transcriptional regulator LsrR (DeoR family)
VKDEDVKTLLQEMEWVRKLLMLQTLGAGYKQKHLAATLGVSEATVSRMMPKGLPKEMPAQLRKCNGGLSDEGAS